MHNGIIENFEPLRARLQQQGYQFVTQTDTEVIAHLIHAHYDGDLLPAVRKAVAEFRGAGQRNRHRRHHGYFTYPLGDPWRSDNHQRASAC
ncbi:MAG: hypothetical protein E6H73_14800 [Betaproteobacteria bacterium]|nr:MAG: hypothetical protein E6H73_14800 [Betaproteobacteria bacterium]